MTITRFSLLPLILLLAAVCLGQTTPPGNNNGQVFGISVNPEGAIQFREADAKSELAKIRAWGVAPGSRLVESR